MSGAAIIGAAAIGASMYSGKQAANKASSAASSAYKYTTNISDSSVLLGGTHILASNTRLVAIHGAGTFTGNGVQLQYNPISFFI